MQTKKIHSSLSCSSSPLQKGDYRGIKEQAFTLVELIVVITILAILATIAFISISGYSQDARNSSRASDVKTIEKSLQLYSTVKNKYPDPQDAQTVSYSGDIVYYQGTFGDTPYKELGNLSNIPLDPLTEQEYIYSITVNKTQYEILAIYEGEIVNNTILSQTHAAETYKPKVNGTYNKIFVKTENFYIPLPSLINAELTNTGITLNDINIKSQVITNGNNLPKVGTKIVQSTGAIQSLNLRPYTGTITSTSTDDQKANLAKQIQDAYSGSSLETQTIYANILSKTGTGELANLVNFIVLGNGANNTVVQTTTTYSCDETTKPADNGHITYTTGTPTSEDQVYIQDATDCGYSCTDGYTGASCETAPITCPTGYVLVPGNSTFSTTDFCVAKYEMKNVGGVATSQSAGNPWVSITQPNAITACNDLGTGYHLITNNEWMTIARNIEANAQNWADGNLGSLVSNGGGLFRGNVNLVDSASCGSNVVLDGDTTGTNCDASGRNKRMHILSNNNEIWDISGNVREHVNGTNNISSTTGEVANGNACGVNNWYSWNGTNNGSASCTFTNTSPTFYSKANHGPLGDYNANNGVGRIYSSTSTNRIFLRGGNWNLTTLAGVFTLSLDLDSASAYADLGFRCAFSVN